jgi:murein DD-endopeptidase MepM/ murein hydrolase activator NlpD
MDKKFYAFLIFPGAHGRLHKLQMPFYIIHLLLAFSAVGIITVAALANSYARMLLKVSNYNSLRSEREALKTQNRTLENTVTTTNAELDSLSSLAAEVALTYGFGNQRRLHFPEAVLALATQTNATVDSSFRASVYAFKLIRGVNLGTESSVAGRGMFSNPQMDHDMIPSLWPVRGQISAGFGQRMDPFSGEDAFHRGVDISVPFGTWVEATADGIVLEAGPESGYGKQILIDHGFGWTTKYGHLSRIFVVVGQELKRGQPIGTVGMTGRSTGPHLHYEVHINDNPVNPARYLRG